MIQKLNGVTRRGLWDAECSKFPIGSPDLLVGLKRPAFRAKKKEARGRSPKKKQKTKKLLLHY